MKNIEIPFDLIQLRNETKNSSHENLEILLDEILPHKWNPPNIISSAMNTMAKMSQSNEKCWKIYSTKMLCHLLTDRIEYESFILRYAFIRPSQYLPKTHKIAKNFMILFRCKIVFAICICMGRFYWQVLAKSLARMCWLYVLLFFVHLIKTTTSIYSDSHTKHVSVCVLILFSVQCALNIEI